MIDFSKFKSLFSVMNYFHDEQMCKQTLADARWNGDVVCPYCGKHHCSTRKNGRYRCNKCKKNFSVLVGTIFENTKLPLYKWFVAMYLISSHKKGVSSCQLSRDIEVSQATAWYMLQKIRLLYPQNDSERMRCVVECDEVYIGGKEKWKHQSMRTPHTQGRSTATKVPVFGMLERSRYIDDKGVERQMTYVHAMAVDKTDKSTLQPIIEQFVDKGSLIMTDELSAYKGLDKLGYRHWIVRHSEAEYVKKTNVDEIKEGDPIDIFTNSIEGFWSHFRRMIVGCYHNVTDEHLQSYIDEAVYRWNTRKMTEDERFEHMFNLSIGLVITWNDLKSCEYVA
ncbi:MAG: IS1595 family transposase [Bacteroidales bacterium]|nr:IS1595 family transposase [Bacteroidales bacterium]